MIVLNCLIGMCLSLLLLIFQLSVPCLAAYILSRLGIVLLPVERRKPNFRSMLVLCLLLVFGGLALLFYHPIVSCPPELQDRFTPEMREEAMAINQGFYSAQVPLFAAKITVDDIRENGEVQVTVLYLFPGSTKEMAFGGPDGYDPIRPLS